MSISEDSPAGEHVSLSDGTRLYVEQHGSEGVCLVMIPGWAYSCEVFRPALPYLAKNHRVVMYDPRGHGRSSAASDGHNYRQHGDDLAEVLDLLGLHQVVLVGWSLGVYDALSYLQAHGNEGVLGLVLVDESPQIIRSDGNAWGEGTEEEVAGLIGLVRSSFLGFFRDYMVSGFVEPPPSDVVDRFVDAARTLTATQAADLLKDATRYDFTELLKSLDDVLPILHIL
ncbi:MAG: alpha/beta hydrolase, partial [Pseudomonadota bacterium]